MHLYTTIDDLDDNDMLQISNDSASCQVSKIHTLNGSLCITGSPLKVSPPSDSDTGLKIIGQGGQDSTRANAIVWPLDIFLAYKGYTFFENKPIGAA
eukprot:scaffold1801_cov79-Skeletonema_menzelii.AAC.9